MNGAKVNPAAWSAIAVLLLLVGLPVAVSSVTAIAYQETSSIDFPENGPPAATLYDIAMTKTGIYDPQVDAWCNDGSYDVATGTKEGYNFGEDCPSSVSPIPYLVDGEAYVTTATCAFYGDFTHYDWKCGDSDLAWNYYGLSWGEDMVNQSVTSFEVRMTGSNITTEPCDDETLFANVSGLYTLSFSKGPIVELAPPPFPKYRAIAETTTTVQIGTFEIYSGLPYEYVGGVQYCIPYFALVIEVDPYSAEDVAAIVAATDFAAGEEVWWTLELDDLEVREQSVSYSSWPGVMPWDSTEVYYGHAMRVGLADQVEATSAMSWFAGAFGIVLMAVGLASTPYWDPVTDWLRRGLRA